MDAILGVFVMVDKKVDKNDILQQIKKEVNHAFSQGFLSQPDTGEHNGIHFDSLKAYGKHMERSIGSLMRSINKSEKCPEILKGFFTSMVQKNTQKSGFSPK